MTYRVLPFLLLLSACGGGTMPVVGPSQVVQSGTGGGTTGPVTSGGGGSLVSQVANPLNLTASENFNLFAFDTLNAAQAATVPALVDTQISGVARYSGNMFARVGQDSEFLRGDLRLLVGFQANTLSGTIKGLQFAGDDASGRGTVPSLDRLTIGSGSFSGNELQAKVNGTFDEGGFFGFSAPTDQHTVDGTLDIVFVDANPVDGSTEMVGTITGTIASNNDGTRSIEGIVSGDGGF